jgi:hypothetical protein
MAEGEGLSKEDLQKTQLQMEANIKLLSQYREEALELDRESIRRIKEEIKLAEQKLELLKKTKGYSEEDAKLLEDSIRKQKNLLKIYKEQGTAFGYILNNTQAIGRNIIEFTRSTAQQFVLAEKIAKVYKGLGKDIGMTGKNGMLLEKSFKGALPSVIEMGMSADELATIYQDISKQSGRVSTLTSKDAETIASIGASMSLSANEAGEMSESFMLMGLSTEKIEENILETYKSAQSMGLNATKVIKVLQQNIGAMQSYSFKGGVKGMTEMAKQAVKMRLDVSDVLQMADKFYQPEAAIEAAANLQMLGGDIAEAFGDPFETMYLARNKPEELAKKLGDMTENMMQFNEETGEYEFPAEVRMQLKAAGEQLGINTDKMIEMARQTSKIKDIKMKFSSVGDDDMRENLASLAKYSEEKGKFVIEHDGKELGLDQITDGMAEEIMKENQSSDENLKDIALNTQVMSERLKNFEEASITKVATATNLYEIMADKVFAEDGVFGKMKEGVEAFVNPYIEKAKMFFQEEVSSTDMSNFNDTLSAMGDLAKEIKDGVIKNLQDLNEKLRETINVINDLGGGADTNVITEDALDMVSMPGSGGRVMTGSFGSLSLDDRDLVVAGDPNKLLGGNSSGVPSKIEFGNINISGRLEVVSPDGSTSNLDMSSIKPQIEKMIINQLNGSFRNGGVTSSKERTDYMG